MIYAKRCDLDVITNIHLDSLGPTKTGINHLLRCFGALSSLVIVYRHKGQMNLTKYNKQVSSFYS